MTNRSFSRLNRPKGCSTAFSLPQTGRVILAKKIGEHRPPPRELDINNKWSFECTRHGASSLSSRPSSFPLRWLLVTRLQGDSVARSDRSNRFFCSPEFKRNQPRRSVCAGQQLQLVDRLVSRNSPPVSCLLWLLPFMNRASFLALRCVAPGLQGLRHFDKRINYLHSDWSIGPFLPNVRSFLSWRSVCLGVLRRQILLS